MNRFTQRISHIRHCIEAISTQKKQTEQSNIEHQGKAYHQ